MTATILWLRQDLRLADQPALQAAIERGGAVIPVFIDSAAEEGEWQPGAASRWWLHQSLESLAAALEQRGSRLVLRRATAFPVPCPPPPVGGTAGAAPRPRAVRSTDASP